MNLKEAQQVFDALSVKADLLEDQAHRLAAAIRVLNTPKPTIFTLTTTTDDKRNKRTWGYYPTEKEARHAITENYGNMRDCLFDYLVLEEYDQGVLAGAKRDVWFHWNEVVGEWLECDKPSFANGVINWAMG